MYMREQSDGNQMRALDREYLSHRSACIQRPDFWMKVRRDWSERSLSWARWSPEIHMSKYFGITIGTAALAMMAGGWIAPRGQTYQIAAAAAGMAVMGIFYAKMNEIVQTDITNLEARLKKIDFHFFDSPKQKVKGMQFNGTCDFGYGEEPAKIHKNEDGSVCYRVSASAKIGENVYIHPTAMIGHDSVIEDGVHIGANTTIDNEVDIGHDAWLGAGVIVEPEVGIFSEAVIEDHAFIGFEAIVGYKNKIGKGAFVGESARLADECKVHQGCEVQKGQNLIPKEEVQGETLFVQIGDALKNFRAKLKEEIRKFNGYEKPATQVIHAPSSVGEPVRGRPRASRNR
jgi:carbonic anhydrase/acetyltransferase-like protein (isoleucine patch superfamily)